MRRLLGRLPIFTIGVFTAVALGVAFFMYSTTRQEVRIAQQMMEDASHLQIDKSNLSEVLAFAHKYKGEARGTWHDNPCLESDCLVTTDPETNDFWERHPKLGYAADRISRRGWRFSVWMWVKDGKLTGIEQWFAYSTPQTGFFVITSFSQPTRQLCHNPFYRLHHAFAAYPGLKNFNVWVNATSGQERELLRLNVDCAVQVSGCGSIAAMAPAAWQKYESDRQFVGANQGKWQDEIAADPNCR